ADLEFARVRADARCLIELRIDRYGDASLDLLKRALARFGAERCVVTCRHGREGGGEAVGETARIDFLAAACAAGAAFVDVELRTLAAQPAVMARLQAAVGAGG